MGFIENLKIYVDVIVIFRKDGVMLPSEIVWDSGVSFPIKRIREIKYGCTFWESKCNRYTVEIDGERKYLYFEPNTEPEVNSFGRWFVENKNL